MLGEVIVVGRALVAVAGLVVVCATLASALQSVVVPRAHVTRLTWAHFAWIARAIGRIAGHRSFEVRDRISAVYAPFALVTLPAAWVTLVIAGFGAMFWGLGVDPLTEALAISGSSLTTLGFERPNGFWLEMISVVEAGLGLGLVALMISYLPTIYAAFQRREAAVGGLEARAGLPPSPAALFTRFQRIGWLERVDDMLFAEWETWFIDIEESHTSHSWLVFFRSPHPERSWITAAGCVLDAAALRVSVIDLPRDARPFLLIRSGFLTLRRIASSFEIPFDPDPAPDDPITVTRAEFDAVCEEMRAAGVPIIDDLDQGWRDYAGWRVNYDTVLVQLATLIGAPTAPWSSDRGIRRTVSPIIRRRRGSASQPFVVPDRLP